MQPLINMALRAARAASELLLQQVDRRDRLQIVSDDGDSFVTSADQESEKTILYHLQKAYPQDSFISRVGLTIDGDSGTTWLIDPLIGSRNFYHGHPLFGIGIACKSGAVVEHSVLLIPMLGEEYWASRGAGAQLNSRRIRVGTATELKGTLVAIHHRESGESLASDLLENGATVRSSGAPAIDLVYTAADKLQAGWMQLQASPGLDAALLILKEAGGLACSESGHPDPQQGKELLFANPRLCKQLLHLRQGVGSQDKSP